MKKLLTIVFFILIISTLFCACEKTLGTWCFERVKVEVNGSILYFNKNQIEEIPASSTSKTEQLIKNVYETYCKDFIILEENRISKLVNSNNYTKGDWKSNGEFIEVNVNNKQLLFEQDAKLLKLSKQVQIEDQTFALTIYYKKIK